MGEGEEYETVAVVVVVVDGPRGIWKAGRVEFEEKELVIRKGQGREAWTDFDVAAGKVVGWEERIYPGGWGEEWKETLAVPGL